MDLRFVMYLNIANTKITKFRCISLDVPFFVVYLNIVNIKLQNKGTSNRLLLVYLNIVNIKLQNSGTSNRLLLVYLNIANKKMQNSGTSKYYRTSRSREAHGIECMSTI